MWRDEPWDAIIIIVKANVSRYLAVLISKHYSEIGLYFMCVMFYRFFKNTCIF